MADTWTYVMEWHNSDGSCVLSGVRSQWFIYSNRSRSHQMKREDRWKSVGTWSHIQLRALVSAGRSFGKTYCWLIWEPWRQEQSWSVKHQLTYTISFSFVQKLQDKNVYNTNITHSMTGSVATNFTNPTVHHLSHAKLCHLFMKWFQALTVATVRKAAFLHSSLLKIKIWPLLEFSWCQCKYSVHIYITVTLLPPKWYVKRYL